MGEKCYRDGEVNIRDCGKQSPHLFGFSFGKLKEKDC